MPPSSLRLIDFSDRELLGVLYDQANEDGWVHTHDIAETLNIKHAHPGQCVGMRLGWLRRYGVVEKHKREPLTWRLTEFGRAMTNGDLTAQARKQLQGLKPEQLVTLTRMVGQRFQSVNDSGAHMIRREWTHSTHGRKYRKR